MSRTVALSFIMLIAASCGATSHSPDGAATESCGGYRPTGECMNEENFAQCLEREAECPGQVIALESCPLQFDCP